MLELELLLLLPLLLLLLLMLLLLALLLLSMMMHEAGDKELLVISITGSVNCDCAYQLEAEASVQ